MQESLKFFLVLKMKALLDAKIDQVFVSKTYFLRLFKGY